VNYIRLTADGVSAKGGDPRRASGDEGGAGVGALPLQCRNHGNTCWSETALLVFPSSGVKGVCGVLPDR
jgi:hypothetical protein